MPEKRFSYSVVECALCLQEAYIDHVEGGKLYDWSQEVHEKVGGQFALKGALINLAVEVEKLWRKTLTVEDRDHWIFDWEFCPMMVAHGIDWEHAEYDSVKLFPDAWKRMQAHAAIAVKFANQEAA